MIARWTRRRDLFLAGLLGGRCRLGCGARVYPNNVVEHELDGHCGDQP